MINENDIKNLKRQLCIDSLSKSDTIFRNILKMSVEGMSSDLFFKYLYKADEYIKRKAFELLEKIDESTCIFHALHVLPKYLYLK